MGKHNYFLRIGFLGALALLVIILLAVITYLAIPKPHFELLGTTQGYPASKTPYDLRASHGYYMVNTGDEMLSLDPSAPRKAGCWIYWDVPRHRFSDPCFGTIFDLGGEYVNGPPSPPMRRFLVRIEGQEIWVSTESVVSGGWPK